MKFTPPDNSFILAAFPEIQTISFLSQGGFKAVYRARIQERDEAFKLLCLPVISPDLDENTVKEQKSVRDTYLLRAQREIKLLGNLDAKETVKLGSVPARIATIKDIEYLGYSEEWLNGENLWTLLRTPARVQPTEQECRSLLRCLVSAIQALWRQGCVHRDIKPSNVIKLDNAERPFVLLDLGIAYEVTEPGLTYVNAMPLATYRYLAPEMAEIGFRQRLDFRSDLYTTGLTVFEYATGRHPVAHDSDDMLRTVSRAIHSPPALLKDKRPDFSKEFCEIIDRLIRKKAMLRPGNLALLQQQIEKLP